VIKISLTQLVLDAITPPLRSSAC